MFVKKDLRKVPRIMREATGEDANDGSKKRAKLAQQPDQQPLVDLKLARRQNEFQGRLDLLCRPQYVCKWRQLQSLSLYDCGLKDLTGVAMLAKAPQLRSLDLGRNPLTSLPDEMGELRGSLQVLWLDDCRVEGSMPSCILELTRLTELRISNNRLTHVPSGIAKLENLEVLALDSNELTTLPTQFQDMATLRVLSLRQNQFEALPQGVPSAGMKSLQQLHLSSNRLTALPSTIVQCPSLQQIVANGNIIDSLPDALCVGSDGADKPPMPNLKQLTLCHNRIRKLPDGFSARFGDIDAATGICKSGDCTVDLQYNPITEADDQEHDATTDTPKQ